MLTIPSVIAHDVLGADRAARLAAHDLLVRLGERVGWNALAGVATRRLLLHLAPLRLHVRQHLRQLLAVQGGRHGLDFVGLADYEGSGILFGRRSSVIRCLVALD